MEEQNTNTVTNSDHANVSHVYYEVGNDLLAKPNALADILNTHGSLPSIIFCNTPSEADMVNVMLGKKGISSYKLIGNVPFAKVAQAIEKIKQGEFQALVITDVAARDMEVDAFDLVINYSIHEDPEIYLHRHAGAENSATDTKIISLVSPLDFGNFHYLKKVVDFEIEKAQLPSVEEVAKLRSEAFFQNAAQLDSQKFEQYKDLVSKVEEHADKDRIIAFLLYSALEVLPAAQNSSKSRNSDRDYDRDRDYNDNRDNGRGRNDRGRDRSDRHNNDSEDFKARRNNYVPPKKDVRIYLGHGTADNFSEEQFVELVKGVEDAGTEDLVKRFSIREKYAFADVPEEISEKVLAFLESATLKDGGSVYFKKATLISNPREESDSDEENVEANSDDLEAVTGSDLDSDMMEEESAEI